MTRRDARRRDQITTPDGAVYAQVIAPNDLVQLNLLVPSWAREKLRRHATHQGHDMQHAILALIDALPDTHGQADDTAA